MTRPILTLVALGLVATIGYGGYRILSEEPRTVTTASDEAYAAWRDAEAERLRFRYDSAVEKLREATRLDPEFAMAYYRLWTLREWMDESEANQHLDTAVTLSDEVSPREQLMIAQGVAIRDENWDELDRLQEELAERFPDDNDVLMQRARRAWEDNDFESAMGYYERVLEKDPERIDIHNQLGYLNLHVGNYDEAIASLNRYNFFAPGLANPHDSLGDAYRFTGEYEKAMQEYATAIEIDPSFVWSAANLAVVLATTGQLDKAAETLEAGRPMLEERGWMNWYHNIRMSLMTAAEDWDGVIQYSGECLEKAKNSEEKEDRFPVPFHFRQAWAYLEKEDLESATQAANVLEEVAAGYKKTFPERAQVSQEFGLAEALLRSHFARATGSPETGIEMLAARLNESSKSPHQLEDYRYELALTYFEAGQFQNAIDECAKLLRVITRHPRTNLLAAKAHNELGNTEDALSHLGVYLDVMKRADKDFPGVADARRLLKKLSSAS